jgi:hypothetical protein
MNNGLSSESITDNTPQFRPGLLAEVWAHLDKLQVSQELRAYLQEAVKAPSRSVRSSPRSMSGRYPSKKVGMSIGHESGTLELPAVLDLENDPEVLFYLEQPPKIKLSYRRRGRNRAYLYTPDLIAVRRDGIVLIECKRQNVVELRAAHDPEFFVLSDGRWSCPPAERAAAALGIVHQLWTEEHFNSVVLSNVAYLGSYLACDRDIPGYDAALEHIHGTLACLARAPIQSVIDKWPSVVTLDHIYLAITRGAVSIDWQASRIRDAQGCFLYRDEDTLRSYVACAQSADVKQQPAAAMVMIAAGASMRWDGQLWRIVTVGTSRVLIECNGRSEQIPLEVLRSLAREGHLEAAGDDARVPRGESRIDAMIRRARRIDLETANRRLEQIRPYLENRRASPPHRTLRRYLSQYKAAQATHGNGFLGLIPRGVNSGNRARRLMPAVVDLALEVANEHLLNPDNVRIKTGWGFLADRCAEKGLPTPSLKWFSKFVREIPAYKMARARGGDKFAYQLEPRVESTGLAQAMTPARVWQRVHIDHTLLDLETIFPGTTDSAGRVWLTLMVDHHSRRTLAVHLSYEPPSYRSVMGVIRECVRRWGRLPESLLVDGGKEFKGVWLQQLCSSYHVNLQYRPAAKPRYGSQIERLFGTLNTNLLHAIKGNTQLRRNVRQMTKAVDPGNFAIWTFADLSDLVERYFFEVYDDLAHRELGDSPRAIYEQSMALSGHRELQIIPFDRHFLLNTSPSTQKGTARVQTDGVKINYLYYSTPRLLAYLGRDVEVRYDPSNLGVAFAFIDREWARLTCSRHASLVWGLTERQLQAFTSEWRQRRSAVEKERLTDAKLIQFLKQVNEQQLVLLERRQAAEERQRRLDVNRFPDDWEEADEPAHSRQANKASLLRDANDLPLEPTIVLNDVETF